LKLIRHLGLALFVFGASFLGLRAVPGPTGALAASTSFDVQLLGANESPAVVDPATGAAHFSFDDATGGLTYTLTVAGVSPDLVTGAQVRRGAVGASGPMVAILSDKGFGSISGKVTLSAADSADLKAGNLYTEIQTKGHPNGAARGQMYSDPATSLSASLRGAANAWNTKNVDAFLNYFTDRALQSEFDFASRAEARQQLPDFIGQDQVTIPGITNLVVMNPTSVAALVNLVLGISLQPENDTFVLQGGIWKFDLIQHVSPTVPPGVTTVDLQAKEFTFDFNQAAASTGNVAFHLHNDGAQTHEANLVRLSPGINLPGLLQTAAANPQGPPPGVDQLASVGPIEPGSSFNLVLTQPLSAGHYAFLCFVTDPADGVPHAFKGMAVDFNVGSTAGSGSTAAILPPNTGDGGLLP
jgi:hypothetical protein